MVTVVVRDAFWLMSMQVGLKAACDCVKVFSETDLTEDLKGFDVPTLIIHGDDDQIVPIADSAFLSSKIVEGAELKVYPGCAPRPHDHTQGSVQRRRARVQQGLSTLSENPVQPTVPF